MDRRLGSFYWVDKARALSHILYSHCMSDHLVLCPSPKRLWGVWGTGNRGRVLFPVASRNVHELLRRDDLVDTRDLGMTDEELGNVHECTHLDITTYMLPRYSYDQVNLIMYLSTHDTLSLLCPKLATRENTPT